MKVTVLLKDGESWRIPVKSETCTIRWLIDQVAHRHHRRRSTLSPPPPPLDTGRITGVERENHEILDLSAPIACVDGEVLTALYVEENDLFEGFTALLRTVEPALESEEASAVRNRDARYEDKLRIGFDDESSTSFSGSSGSAGRSLLTSSARRATPIKPRLLSVLASMDGDRVDLQVRHGMTAKEVIVEVVSALYGQLDPSRHYGLATLDGVLVGPAMPVEDLFGKSRLRARVVLVYPPDDSEDTDSDLTESLGVSMGDITSLGSALVKDTDGTPVVRPEDDLFSAESDKPASPLTAHSKPRRRSSKPSKKKKQTDHRDATRRLPKSRSKPSASQSNTADSSDTTSLLQQTLAKLDTVESAARDLASSLQRREPADVALSPAEGRRASMDVAPSSIMMSPPRNLSNTLLSGGSPRESPRGSPRDSPKGSPRDSPNGSPRSIVGRLSRQKRAMSGGATGLERLLKMSPQRTSKELSPRAGPSSDRLKHLDVSFDEVELCEFLGKGGSTTVYRGTVRGLSVAVKLFDLEFADKYERDSVRNEIDHMRALHHDNIVTFLGAQERGKTVSIFMEYFMTSLHDVILKRRPSVPEGRLDHFSVSDVCAISAKVARALKYMHQRSQPIIHRDVKSENVFVQAVNDDLTEPYVVKLGDFGEACIMEKRSFFSQRRVIRSTSNVGTTEFRAPELWSKNKAYSVKIDIWAFGMVLFELLTLDLPYRRENLDRFSIPKHIAGGLRPQLPPNMDPSLSPIVKLFHRCTEKGESDRPTAKECQSALEKIRKKS